MSETLPDRLSIDPKSRFFNEELIKRGIGIRFNGVEKDTVEEYCVSEGWVTVSAGGKSRDRHGQPLKMKLHGTVEPYLRNDSEPEAAPQSEAAETKDAEATKE